jgi:predicted O-methyltransferase YrrM
MSLQSSCSNVLKKLVIKLERTRLSASPPWAGYLFREVQRRATAETVDFIYENMPTAIFFEDQFRLLKFALKKRSGGLIAEFGVDTGSTINFMSNLVDGQEVHGFDSFQGLPEDWVGYADFSTRFQRNGIPPTVSPNVRLHVGLFADTLPAFLRNYREEFSLIHVDCDLYSSTKVIFDHCSSRIRTGTIIVFDEFFNYPNWQRHEYKAFLEFAETNGVKWEYLGYSGNQVAVRITGMRECARS